MSSPDEAKRILKRVSRFSGTEVAVRNPKKVVGEAVKQLPIAGGKSAPA
jgi:hypothetical protein